MTRVSTLSNVLLESKARTLCLMGKYSAKVAAISALFICLSVYVFGCLPACVSVTICILCYLRGQKRVLYPLGLKFQTVESCCIDSGTWIWALWKSTQCSKMLSHFFPAPLLLLVLVLIFIISFFLFFLLSSTKDWGLLHTEQMFYHWAYPLNPFVIGSHSTAQACFKLRFS